MALSTISFQHAALLWLLPLALLPWLPSKRPAQASYAALRWVAHDRRSRWLDWLLRTCASLGFGALVIALAAPRSPESASETVVRGAEIVVLLDRSLSMDQPFGKPSNAVLDLTGPSKSIVAQRLLAGFARKRAGDLFGLVLFSTLPLPVLPFTRNQDAIQAAIGATATSRALADTDAGLGLLAAARYFEGRPYSGSRVVVLISDGGAQLDPVARERITDAFLRNRISLYWMYIRSRFGPGLPATEEPDSPADDAIPERALNRFFRSLKTPYRVYQAGDAEALQRAISDLGRLENAPLQLRTLQPGADLRQWPLALAFAVIGMLACVSLWTIRPWRG
ncbi:MAG: VWA domain-containing protein [Burkholderiaceae bacterium]|nr:VWA domain-containing protein [Burkholderiaceae bacterium]